MDAFITMMVLIKVLEVSVIECPTMIMSFSERQGEHLMLGYHHCLKYVSYLHTGCTNGSIVYLLEKLSLKYMSLTPFTKVVL